MTRLQAIGELLAVGALMAAPGCPFFGWMNGTTSRPREDTQMPGIEARRILIRARLLLHDRQAGALPKALRLSQRIIDHCQDLRYVWQAYLVQTTTYQLLAGCAPGETQAKQQCARAATVARRGVEHLLRQQPGLPDASSVTAMKMLLMAYVETAVAAGKEDQATKLLELWEETLLQRSANSPGSSSPSPDSIRGLFTRLKALAARAVGSRGPETLIRKTIRQYLRRWNTGDTMGVLELLVPGSLRAAGVQRALQQGRSQDATGYLYLFSTVRVEVITGTFTKRTATATCDLLVTSPAGWASVVRGVRFQLVETSPNRWRIQDVHGYP